MFFLGLPPNINWNCARYILVAMHCFNHWSFHLLQPVQLHHNGAKQWRQNYSLMSTFTKLEFDVHTLHETNAPQKNCFFCCVTKCNRKPASVNTSHTAPVLHPCWPSVLLENISTSVQGEVLIFTDTLQAVFTLAGYQFASVNTGYSRLQISILQVWIPVILLHP